MASKSETLRLLVLHSSADNTEEIIKALKGAGTPTRPQVIDSVFRFLLKMTRQHVLLGGGISWLIHDEYKTQCVDVDRKQ